MAIFIFILMKQVFFCLLSTTVLVSCGGNNLKRVLVISRGTATIDKDAKTITVTSGTSSEEQTVDFDTKDKVTLQINSQAGKATVDLDSPGLLRSKCQARHHCRQLSTLWGTTHRNKNVHARVSKAANRLATKINKGQQCKCC